MQAYFRFYGELNDFLARPLRQRTLVCRFDGRAAVKDLMEAQGVPHPEVDVVLANGEPVSFTYLVGDGDRIAVYPAFRTLPPGAVAHVGPPPSPVPRFVADGHLGRLAAYLRLLGFDTGWRNDATDHALAETSAREDRTLLTRDVGLLKHGQVRRGYFVRQTLPGRQLREVVLRYDLGLLARPFTRCLRCNERLAPAVATEAAALVPVRVAERHRTFWRCPSCRRLYWEGTHHARMRALVHEVLGEVRPAF